MSFDFLEAKPVDSVTLTELNNTITNIARLREQIAEQKKYLETLNAEMEKYESYVQNALEQHNLTKFSGAEGTVYIQNRHSVTFPKDPEKAEIFRSWLMEQGMEGMLTMNHQSLNAFLKPMFQEAEESGRMLSEVLPPGIDAPTTTPIVGFRKGK